ncbi:MAG: UDP-N-acetylmuramoyl-tripeptide--D-alanyl-D-alanine ligase [Phycisphaerae bacterium]|nr:UDP-N-acetylmuramoyl-tripeptide--D-alanyl-D-alanine ligase [Phycisphaerae bacterium]
MTPTPLTQLAHWVGVQAPSASHTDLICHGISTDSRTTQPGDCFFALTGEQDGHQYVARAFDQGAVCAVVSRPCPGLDQASPAPLIQVHDTLQALARLAQAYRRQGRFTVVGITGSVGKTSTRWITAHCLKSKYRVHQSPKNFNNHIGLPMTLLTAKASDEVIVAEMGSNAPGEIADLSHVAEPDVAVVTNVYAAHLEGFGCVETILREKLSIVRGLKASGPLFVNADIPALADLACMEHTSPVMFGLNPHCDIPALNVTYLAQGSRITIDCTEIDIPLPGPGNVVNTLAAWAVCRHLGVSIEAFAAAMKTLPPIAMRGETLDLAHVTLICDCYNANPASMKNALAILDSQARSDRRCVFVVGDMAELGPESQALHETLGCDIARSRVDLVISVGPLSGLAAQTAKAKSNNRLQIHCFEDTMDACTSLKSLVRDGDLVLIKGSRSARLEQAVDVLKSLSFNV